MKKALNDIKSIAEIMLSLSDEQRRILLDKSCDMQFENVKSVTPDIENKLGDLAKNLSLMPEDKQREVYEYILSLKEQSSTAEISFAIKA